MVILNQAVYNLFFRRKKGQIFNDGKNLINYNISSEDENYLEEETEKISKTKESSLTL